MNYSTFMSKLGGAVLAVVTSGLIITSAQAQTDYYFDPSHLDHGLGSGGTGTWDTGATSDFFHGGTDTTFPAGAAGIADFDGVGGTVTVNGSVDPFAMNFGGYIAYTVNAGAAGSIDLGTATNFNISDSRAGVTLNAPITFTGGTGDISVNVNSTFGGVVFGSTVTNNFTSDQIFNLNFSGGGTDTFKGNILATNSGYQNNSGDPTNDNINVTGNTPTTLLVDNGNFDRFTVTSGNSLLTGASGVTVIGTDSIVSGTIGGATAGLSTFTGKIINFGGSRTFTAAAGGRVDFNGANAPGGDAIEGGGVGAGNNLIINGAGIVAFTAPNGNSYGGQYNTTGNDNAVGTEVARGTLLLDNTSGSATGQGFNQNSTPTSSIGSNNIVQIDNNLTGVKANLGGYGYTLEQVVAMGPKSMLTPGDISAAGVITPGTLHLDNGLTASLGVTVNLALTLTPATSGMIQVGTTSINPFNGNVSNGAPAVALTLNGPVLVLLSGAINTSDTYTMFYSTAGTAWDVNSAAFTYYGIPNGYAAVTSYVANSGGVESLDVSFVAVPEPSTWALMGLGMLFLITTVKFRKLRV